MRKARIAAAAVVATMAVFGLAAPAHAADTDLGNDDPNCDYGEICFSAASGNSNPWGQYNSYLRTFYWSNWDHDVENWRSYFAPHSSYVTHPIMDDITGVINNDTSCDLKLWDRYDDGTWYQYADISNRWPGYQGDYGARRNNAHSRC